MLNKRAAAEQLRKYATVARLIREQRMMQKRAAEQQSGTSKPKKPKSPSDPVERLRNWIRGSAAPAKPSIESDPRHDILNKAMGRGQGDPIRGYQEYSEEKQRYERKRKFQPK